MTLSKNTASLISDSLATARADGGGKSEAEEPHELEALGQSILDAIKSGNARSVGECFKSAYDAVSLMPQAEEEAPPLDTTAPDLPSPEEG